ncbi:MAG TPA: ACT domain-containing protein [Spirochaetota bacterium]|nr:ACT domain-containing protein [Spirochaetota bacterium]HOD14572.1 ACT domain-containing protein [Spirochaetota bacterium]HPN12185.1 ACT domain-containing protein [Spirochaetota bacterium]
MMAHQLLVPADNKPGMLAKVTSVLAREKINIRAITISSFGERGFFNIIVDEPKRAHRELEKAGLTVELKDVIAVLIDDRPGGLDRLVQLLASKSINVENAYGFVLESRVQAVFVIDVNNRELALQALKDNGYKTIDAESLNSVEPFHYMKY